jgi:hypothetical protein
MVRNAHADETSAILNAGEDACAAQQLNVIATRNNARSKRSNKHT